MFYKILDNGVEVKRERVIEIDKEIEIVDIFVMNELYNFVV